MVRKMDIVKEIEIRRKTEKLKENPGPLESRSTIPFSKLRYFLNEQKK